MKKQKRVVFLIVFLFILFIAVSSFTFIKSNERIRKGYLAAEGTAAANFSSLTASVLNLTNEDVKILKAMTYDELLNSDYNKNLEKLMSNKRFLSDVDYAYVMIHLDPKDVKYYVTEDNKDFYDKPVGTKLDIMWLLDVNITDEQINDAAVERDDIGRYSAYIPADAEIFMDSPSYIYNNSAWGEHICGYSPLYSVEGDYIGVVGIELKVDDYYSYSNMAIWALAFLLIISLLMLSIVFITLYLQYGKEQRQRIYTDSLTRINNRSFFNDQFNRKMHSKRLKDSYFSIMIADIDLFKKVNDTFGHEVGDSVLIEMATILVDTFGKDSVCRFGGEEFVIGMWARSPEVFEGKLTELYKRIANHSFSSQLLTITLSTGCAYYKTDKLGGWLISSMLRAADCNLYYIKEHGRNAYKMIEYDKDTVYQKG